MSNTFQAALASRNRDRIVRSYRENPALINEILPYGSYPLVYAVENGTPRMVQTLLEMGSDPNLHVQVPENAYSPLILAVTAHNTAMVRLLLAHGADVNLGNPYTGETPLADAIWNLCTDEVTSYEIFNMLMSKHPNPNVLNEEKSGLYMATEDENTEIARILLVAGASVDYGFPLHVAVQEKNLKVLQQFLKWGANPNLRHKGLTPLHLAATAGHEDLVEILLEEGADPEIPNNAGQNPANVASTNRVKNAIEPQNLQKINLNKPNWFNNLGIPYQPLGNEAAAAIWYQQRGIHHTRKAKARKSNTRKSRRH